MKASKGSLQLTTLLSTALAVVLFCSPHQSFADSTSECEQTLIGASPVTDLVRWAESAADFIYSIIPRKKPSQEALESALVIAHRGAHDHQKMIMENTMRSFELAAENGVYGVELDIRWTKDNQAIVLHDSDTERVFGEKWVASEYDFKDLRARFPEIPLLKEVIDTYGEKLHLMIELKEPLDTIKKIETFKELIRPLQAERDFHVIALEFELFNNLDFLPSSALLGVALTNTSEMSRGVIDRELGGLTGHYLLMAQKTLKKHQTLNQKLGTGFVSSKNLLYRELNRGVSLIFTNHALKIQKILDEAK